VINGLTPALLISVEPSGMVPPFRVKLEFVSMVDSGEAVPVDDVAPLVDAQVEAAVEPNPPPSKLELVIGIDVMPDPFMLQFETGAGLNPPGSISVAPSGIPVPLFDPVDMLGPSMPSGEVAPMPGVVIELCACAAVEPKRTTAVMMGKTLIELLLGFG
jgi:hypothetical protein